MKTIEKILVTQLRCFLLLNTLFLLLAAVSVPCLAQNKDSQMAKRERVLITTVTVKPDMTGDFENLIKNEYNPGIAKGGAKWSDVWRNAVFGNGFDYTFVTPIDGFAQLDGISPLMKGLGKEGAAAWYAKAGKMVTNVRGVAYEVRDDLSYRTNMTAPPKMAVVTHTSVAPGRASEFENFIKNDLLPVVKQSGIAGYWMNKTMFGGDVNEYSSLVLLENFAELEKGPPQVRVLGQEGAMKLVQKLPVGVVVRQERIFARYVPELSYRPAMTTNK